MNEFEKWSIKGRTDMAIEEVTTKSDNNIKYKVFEHGPIEVSKIVVLEGAEINKKPGLYFNIDLKEYENRETSDLLEEVTTKYLSDMLEINNIKDDSAILIVGLGNADITPDALGPKVAKNIFVTKHIFDIEPGNIEEGFKNVSSIVPGVMGNTGIETFETVKSIIDKTKPDLIIVIDALASTNIERLNKSIQISDVGISPGSGVGNKRKELSKESLGIPTIAIGVPTVVDAASITATTIEKLLKHLGNEIKNKSNALEVLGTKKIDFDNLEEPSKALKKELLGHLGSLTNNEKKQVIYETLAPGGLNLIVTPKEIDESIINLSRIISEAINKSLHKALQ